MHNLICVICNSEFVDTRPRRYCTNYCRGVNAYRLKIADGRYQADVEKKRGAYIPVEHPYQYPEILCAEQLCDRKHHARGLCKMHYRRWARATGLENPPSDAWNDKRRSNSQARRALMDGPRSPVLRSLIIKRDGLTCKWCDRLIDPTLAWPHLQSITLDHIVPLSKGGTHAPHNAQLMHLSCNASKGTNPDRSTRIYTVGGQPGP